VTVRFHYTWGDQDVAGVGLTTVQNSPAVQLLSVECVGIGTISVNWVLIDPSGDVYDAITSARIPGATAVLEYNDGGTWRVLDPVADAAMMDPDINPQTTSLSGRYAWDVSPGEYRVQISKAGCTSNTGGPVTIPPPVTDLDIGITCSDPDGDGLSSFVEVSEAGGTSTDPNNPDSDGDTVEDGDEDCDSDSLTNLVEVSLGTDPCSSDAVDSDLDGCTNIEEFGALAELGGRRDSGNFWDFFDVWTHPAGNPTAWVRNGNIDLFFDIFGVADRYGASGSHLADPLVPPTDNTGYHPAFDRSAPTGDPWDIGRGSGTIDLFNDIFGVAFQYGHSCNGP
jgi:hypothetical protein